MKKILLYIWKNLEEIAVFILFCFIMATVTLQIVNRKFIGLTLLWTEELARFLYIWVAFVGWAYVTKKRKALRIELLPDALSPRLRALFDMAEDVIVLGLGAWLMSVFIGYIQFTWRTVAPALRFPIRFVYIIFPIGMGLMFIRAAACLVQDAKRLANGKGKEEKPT